MPKLVYIGGYGHSGSTLLEYLLSGSPKVLACGEILSAARQQMSKQWCTCGEPTARCVIWAPLAEASSQNWTHETLALALLQRAGDDYAVVTDSSKTAWGAVSAPFSFRRKLGSEFALIHIVRDPRAVAWSALNKAVRQGKVINKAWRGVATACGWWVANLACVLFGRLYPQHYCRVRYEDMARSPREQVLSLFGSVMPGLSCNLDDPRTANNRHQLFGNRIRSRTPSLHEIKEDRAWEAAMPRRYRWLVEGLTWPLAMTLGYYRHHLVRHKVT